MAVPKKVADRLVAGIKHYQPILNAAKTRDVGEADTVTIVKDMACRHARCNTGAKSSGRATK